jgi:hypothetical protein
MQMYLVITLKWSMFYFAVCVLLRQYSRLLRKVLQVVSYLNYRRVKYTIEDGKTVACVPDNRNCEFCSGRLLMYIIQFIWTVFETN